MLAKIYGAAVRAIMLQKPSLGGVSSGIEWYDESYRDVSVDQQRTVRSAVLTFQVWIDGVVVRGAGPTTPIPPDPETQPGSQWPKVEEADATVVLVPPNEEVNP
jgi:hypothetical protein